MMHPDRHRFGLDFNVNEIALRPARTVDTVRQLVLLGFPAFAVELPQFDAEKECKGGAFSAGFSNGFQKRR
jgi:hypothetical protein